MRLGRPLAPLTLTMTERTTLQQWTRRPRTAQALAQRARLHGLCGRAVEYGRSGPLAGDPANGGQVARSAF